MKFKESETLELKKSTSELKEGVISIASILNKHQNGELYFGIKNDGTVVGQEISEKTLRDVSTAISDHIEPRIYPEIKREDINGKPCIKINFSGNDIPYFAFGRSYIRVSDGDRRLSKKEIENIILNKNKDKLQWDREACKNAKINEISHEKLGWFLKSSNLEYASIKNSLIKLNLMENSHLLNAAVILFGKKPQKHFPNAKLRCAVFGTADTSFTIDMQDFEGDLFYLIEKAQEYILKNIHIGMRLEGLRRIDVPEVDKSALREAIINAFCHRDYYKYDSVNVAVFKDRVEIRSPGLLYGSLTIDRIRREMVSERRNELIADMLHRIHFIEKCGRGISLILSKEPLTDFKEVGQHFIVVFKRKPVEKDLEKDLENLNKNQRKIIDEIKRNPSITQKELSEAVKINEKNIRNNIAKLKEKGLLKRIGPDKGGHWEVVGK